MGVSGGLYNLVLLLHILAVVVAFGGFITNAPYARLARQRGGAEGLAIGEASASVTERVAQSSFYAVPVLGILLVVLSDGAFGFDELWISLSFLLYIIAAVILRAMLIPGQRRANRLAAERVAAPAGVGGGGSRVGELERLGQRLAALGGVFNLLFVAILALMIWKPGA
ncbi:MAG: DUF2269 domain-containing protein [Actinomycetota bacterium]|jgi:uncharacterized membrane protein|nr:DUF2269 domain-containing protein [Actinomycetota bacterium]